MRKIFLILFVSSVFLYGCDYSTNDGGGVNDMAIVTYPSDRYNKNGIFGIGSKLGSFPYYFFNLTAGTSKGIQIGSYTVTDYAEFSSSGFAVVLAKSACVKVEKTSDAIVFTDLNGKSTLYDVYGSDHAPKSVISFSRLGGWTLKAGLVESYELIE